MEGLCRKSLDGEILFDETIGTDSLRGNLVRKILDRGIGENKLCKKTGDLLVYTN